MAGLLGWFLGSKAPTTQEAQRTERIIISPDNPETQFLSITYPSTFWYCGVRCQSISSCLSTLKRRGVELGLSVSLGEADAVSKRELLLDVNLAKFTQNPEFIGRLVATHPKEIIEDPKLPPLHLSHSDWKGEDNILGKTLMELREVLILLRGGVYVHHGDSPFSFSARLSAGIGMDGLEEGWDAPVMITSPTRRRRFDFESDENVDPFASSIRRDGQQASYDPYSLNKRPRVSNL